MARRRFLVKTSRQTSSKSSPSEDKIRQRAYSIWEQKGRPQNNDFDIWLEAERDLK